MNERKSGDDQQRAPGADRGREGFGDDGGTRVGRPAPAEGADQHTGPSSQPVKEGLEGAIFDDSEDAHGRGHMPKSGSDSASSRESQRGSGGGGGSGGSGNSGASTGAGAEAAEGTHNAMRDRAPEENSGVDAAADQIGSRGGVDRRGSEPLTGRTNEHVSGYGGAGGAPKKSSDQRE